MKTATVVRRQKTYPPQYPHAPKSFSYRLFPLFHVKYRVVVSLPVFRSWK